MGDRLRIWYETSRDILLSAGHEFGRDRAGRMAAAISYRSVFALAPLLIIAVSVLGAFLGSREEAQEEFISTIEGVLGTEAAEFIAQFLVSAIDFGSVAAVVGVVLLFWTASSLFLEMQHDLNDIFDVPYEHISGFSAFVRKRVIGFLWSLGLGVAILAVWSLNAIWRFLEGLFPQDLTAVHTTLGYFTPVLSILILPFMFGLVFQSMTALRVRWRAVWWGGLFTAVVFVAAAWGIGRYFSMFGTPTALGFASSLVVVLFLAYFLSSVFLFGAEVTKIYSDYLDRQERGPQVEQVQPDIFVSHPEETVPKWAILGFLGGLVVGWRRSRR